MDQPIVLLSAGGTGGHVFPARALAEELIGQGFAIEIATDERGLRYFEGLDASIPRHVIDSGTYGKGVMSKISGGIAVLQGIVQSLKLVRRIRPVAIVGFGGYPSVPPLLAGQVLGIPTILHEQNAILGLANKILAPFATRLALSYVVTTGLSDKMKSRSVVTGNPIRKAIADLSSLPYPDRKDKTTIMVVGGSQGAKVFSDVVPHALAALPQSLQERLFIIQQSRADAVDAVRSIYASTKLDFEIRPFFDDMPDRIKATHLFITRSGASTVAELTAAGRPAIYVPFPWNRDLQQVFNAEQVSQCGGGWMILEKDLTVETLSRQLNDLLSNPETLEKAASSAKSHGRIDATQRLARIVAEFR